MKRIDDFQNRIKLSCLSQIILERVCTYRNTDTKISVLYCKTRLRIQKTIADQADILNSLKVTIL